MANHAPTFTSSSASGSFTEIANTTGSTTLHTLTGTMNFKDQDHSDTHTTTATLNSTSVSGGTIIPAASLAHFQAAMTSHITSDSNGSGKLQWTFADPDSDFDFLSKNQTLVLTYDIMVSDNHGGTAIQTVQVTVTGTDDKPVISTTALATVTEQANQTLSLSPDTVQIALNFTDVDLANTGHTATVLSASATGNTAGIIFGNAELMSFFHVDNVVKNAGSSAGTINTTFSAADLAFDYLAAGEHLNITYVVQLDDHAGGVSTQNVQVTVVGTNDAPIYLSGPESAHLIEDQNVNSSGNLTAHGDLFFTDVDLSDTHTVSTTVSATRSGGGAIPLTNAQLLAAFGTSLEDSTGHVLGEVDWNFAFSNSASSFLSGGETLTLVYHVTVQDPSGGTATQDVTVTILGTNHPVMITSGAESASVSELADTTGSAAIDTTTTVPAGTLAFTDADTGDTHTVTTTLGTTSVSGGGSVPAATQADLTAAISTTLHDSTGTGTGGIDWSFAIADKDLDFLAAGETLTVTYDVTVADGFTSSTQTVTVTATGATDPLVVHPATAIAADTSLQDTGNFLAVGNLISDSGDTAGDSSTTMSISDVNGSAGNVGSFVAGAYGNLLVFSDGTYLYQANANVDPLQAGDNPTDTFNFTVTDSLGRSQATTLTVNVIGADDAPVITAANAFGSLTEDAGPSVVVNGGFETGDFTGWSSSGATVEFTAIGGEFGNYSANLSSGFLEQDPTTTAGQHYTVSFDIAGDPESSGTTSFEAFWDGIQLVSTTNVAVGFTHYSFDVVGDASDPTTQLFFDFADSGNGLLLDNVKIDVNTATTAETTAGSISFADIETADTHTASFTPQSGGYVGTFSVDPVTEAGGSGTVAWHYTVNNSDIQFLSQGQVLNQTYAVFVTDNHGVSTEQDVTVAISGTNDAPTAVSENVITDVGPNGTVDIAPWALAANDTDPDTADHLFVNSIGTSSGGNAVLSGDAFFTDDATAGGSFTYTTSDGIATSSNAATATVINNATNVTSLTGTSGDDVIIATNGTESLSGGGGNDLLIGNSGSHVMTGGSGNDTFAFLHTTDGPGIITDFNNTTEHDHIAISASGFGGGLTANMDVTSTFETSSDDQFSGSAQFHFDTGNQTLYYSSDGTQAAAITVTQVQAGVMLNPHDLLIV
jgi:VCBS repeat-containing protein